MRFGSGKVEFEQRMTSFPSTFVDEETHYFTIVAAKAFFICRETSHRTSFARISSEEISDSPDRSWMDESGRRGRGGARPRERNGTALRNFTRRRPTARQTRAMDEMLTRRETIDYSRQNRSRQVGREMVFLY